MHQYSVVETGLSTSAATVKTLIQVAASATRRGILKELSISFASVNTADGVALVELLRQTTAGTSTSRTPRLNDPADAAALFTCGVNFSAEPTPGDVMEAWDIPVQGGNLVYQPPYGDDLVIAVSGRLGIRVTTPQAQSNIVVSMKWQE